MAMATCFRAPWKHPPTISETAAHFGSQNIAAVIFPVDAERETGYRRYSNDEVAEQVAQNSDVLIQFASIDPWKGKMGVREARRLIRDYKAKGLNFIQRCRVSFRTIGWLMNFTMSLKRRAASHFCTRAKPVLDQGCPVVMGCG